MTDAVLYFTERSSRFVTRGGMRLVSYRLVAQRVTDAGSDTGTRQSSVRFREVGPAELKSLSLPRPDWVIDHRFDQGCQCIGAFRGDEMISFLWFSEGPYLEDEVRARFRPEPAGVTAWDFDVWIDPRYRMGRTFSRIWADANARMRERGIRWTMSRISSFNAASLAAHRRLGARFVGRAVFLRMGQWQITWSSTGPWFHVSRHRVPLIRVPAPEE